eukprot:CAMPEP_0167798376 /NCGR_PEP_ID=MMETSP0111_2-20121227/16280_1 /TAXON_ID=91324 /ORGANISM="Lotharella globosa, Strain CCCM811" /LENGTH=94 /DNA_ID=CAMNT_0007692795 /DNA_START=169 /DNA_END=449 /DNA_ORIENTATION=+
MFGTSDAPVHHEKALLALETKSNLLAGLDLFPEDGLGLPSESGLLPVVPPLALREQRGLARLVLRDTELLVTPALFVPAVSSQLLREEHHGVGG